MDTEIRIGDQGTLEKERNQSLWYTGISATIGGIIVITSSKTAADLAGGALLLNAGRELFRAIDKQLQLK